MTERENEMTAMNTSGKRQIKANEVKPGMEIEIVTTRKMTVDRVSAWDDSDWELSDDSGHVARVNADAKITVLSEPHPEEPRWIAARAKLRDYRFFRVDESDRPWRKADCMGRASSHRYSWSEICSLGPVQVIPDQGWTAPDESTPEVPEKLYVWPENDEHLRGHKWCDNDGDTAQYINGAWRYLWPSGPGFAHAAPLENGPWTRRDV